MDEDLKNNIRTNKNKIIQVGPNAEGKIPPQVLDLEESVLGAIMLDKMAIDVVNEILIPESFYKDAHLLIFRAMVSLYTKREPIDLLTVTQELREQGTIDLAGGAYYVSKLTMRLTSAANVEFHARIIQEKYIQRELIKISNLTIQKAYEDTCDVFKLKEEIEASLYNLNKKDLGTKSKRIDVLYSEQVEQIDKQSNRKSEMIGIPTGIRAIDKVMGGMKKQHLIIIAARPGMGKTALVAGIMKHVAYDLKIPTAMFSLDMPGEEICGRITSHMTNIPGSYLSNYDVKGVFYEQLMQGLFKVKDMPLWIDDRVGLKPSQIRSAARRFIIENKVQLIILDYLGKIKSDNPKQFMREQIVNDSVCALKDMAKELNIPVIALAQLSRDVEKRAGEHKPELGDLRDSGAIEQEADAVIFLYRPEYYKIYIDKYKSRLPTGYSEAIFAKHRQGQICDVPFMFEKEFARFKDFEVFGYKDLTPPIDFTVSQNNKDELPF